MSPKIRSSGKGHLADNRFLFFGWMVLANLGLSALSLPGWGKILLFLAGISLPLFLIWKKLSHSREEADDLLTLDFFPSVPAFAWMALILLAFFVRFYHLTDLSGWPMTDEAWENFYALNLMKHWQWNLLYCVTDLPPGYFWLQALCFKFLGVSLTTLWFLPALLSFLVFAVLALASRAIFSRSLAYLMSGLAGVSYWPLLVGRTSEAGGLALAWECLCLGLLVPALRKNNSWWLIFLGAAVGAGFYTYHSWWPVAFLFCGVVFYRQFLPWKGRPPEGKGLLLAFYALGLAGTAFPFWFALLSHGTSGFLSDLFLFHSRENFLNGWHSIADYFSVLLWGKDLGGNILPPCYDLLNPFWSTAFLTGAVLILRSHKSRIGLFALASIPVLAAPGLLTVSVDPFRIISAMPMIFFVATAGLGWILKAWKPLQAWRAFLVVLLLAAFYDGSYLWGTYHQSWTDPASKPCQDNKSVESWRAYELLQRKAQQEGPGYLLTDLQLFPFDQSLTLAGYSFDWLRNPALDRRPPRWLALFTNPHLLPLLQKRYPQGQFLWLSEELGEPYGGQSLMILETKDLKPTDLDRWLKADQGFRQITLRMIYQTDKRTGEEALTELNHGLPLVRGDSFLECSFWLKSVFNHVLVGDGEGALQASQAGLQAGGPNAVFYDQMGEMYWKKKDRGRAMESFQKAIKCQVDMTPAHLHLKALAQEGGF